MSAELVAAELSPARFALALVPPAPAGELEELAWHACPHERAAVLEVDIAEGVETIACPDCETTGDVRLDTTRRDV